MVIEPIDSLRIKDAGPALDAVYLITFPNQEFGKVASILPSDACN